MDIFRDMIGILSVCSAIQEGAPVRCAWPGCGEKNGLFSKLPHHWQADTAVPSAMTDNAMITLKGKTVRT
jgi:hypothetical protein